MSLARGRESRADRGGDDGYIVSINGPVVKIKGIQNARLRDLVRIGEMGITGEIIRVDKDLVVAQAFEETDGVRLREPVTYLKAPLSMELGPGLLNRIFDGLQRPLSEIAEIAGGFIERGIVLPALSRTTKWHFVPAVRRGDVVRAGDALGHVPETELIRHHVLVPPGHPVAKVVDVVDEGEYSVEDTVVTVSVDGSERPLKMYHPWPIRDPRPYLYRRAPEEPLITGMRVVDLLYPIAKGGAVTVPGGFGTGKTVVQHNLAKWSDAHVIVFIGCGERGNELADVLEEFPKIVDPRSERPIMERTIVIGNTSNMPVAAREASIFAGVTMAEYYRDMGYHVTLLADSTSRWAEALRELSGRLEEMPAEGGYPAYLATRLASFYERAGYVRVLGSREKFGSVSIVGAVSPPSGDFSEPVTKTTKRFVRGFWALDAKLAYSRHYPAISWVDSYSFYPETVRSWWDKVGEEWYKCRAEFSAILSKSDDLEKIVQLIGPDALPYEQQLILFTADVIKKSFLAQSAFHPVDRYCSPEKLFKTASMILHFHEQALKLVRLGIPLFQIKELEAVSRIMRIGIDVENDQVEKIDVIRRVFDEEVEDLKRMFGGVA
ncbi:MAG: ATP synthase subunit A [Promethearchaeota archaeon]